MTSWRTLSLFFRVFVSFCLLRTVCSRIIVRSLNLLVSSSGSWCLWTLIVFWLEMKSCVLALVPVVTGAHVYEKDFLPTVPYPYLKDLLRFAVELTEKASAVAKKMPMQSTDIFIVEFTHARMNVTQTICMVCVPCKYDVRCTPCYQRQNVYLLFVIE